MWGVKSVVGWDRKDRDGVGAASGLAGEREREIGVWGRWGKRRCVYVCVCWELGGGRSGRGGGRGGGEGEVEWCGWCW